MKKLVVFTGAGVSEESGIKTFRDSDGLWENYNIMDVATPEAWQRHPKVVLEFYNARRKQVREAKPNQAHELIASLEHHFNTLVITQNIDDLHERAGSTNVLHLHGEIMKSRSIVDHRLTYPVENEIRMGDKCSHGGQLRPHVVWFGEEVPAMFRAEAEVRAADILIVVGTSLNVYPAAGLLNSLSPACPIFLVDPGQPLVPGHLKINWVREKAGKGMMMLKESLLLLA